MQLLQTKSKSECQLQCFQVKLVIQTIACTWLRNFNKVAPTFDLQRVYKTLQKHFAEIGNRFFQKVEKESWYLSQ